MGPLLRFAPCSPSRSAAHTFRSIRAEDPWRASILRAACVRLRYHARSLSFLAARAAQFMTDPAPRIVRADTPHGPCAQLPGRTHAGLGPDAAAVAGPRGRTVAVEPLAACLARAPGLHRRPARHAGARGAVHLHRSAAGALAAG